MNMHVRSATLIALAAGLFAADPIQQVPVVPIVKDSDLKLTVGGQIQFRADWSKARTSAGQPYDVNAVANGKSDDLDFYLRRCRLFVNGTYGDYSLKFGMRADNADKVNNGGGRTFEIHYASITRKWAGDATQYLQIGLDYAFFNSASYGSSSAHLFPAARATEGLMAPRGTGVGYRLDAGNFFFGVDVQNNNKVMNGTGDDTVPAAAAYQSEGLCYTTRLEFTPSGAWAIKPKDYKETFAGKAGNGWMLGLEAGYNAHDTEAVAGAPAGATSQWKDTLTVGAESLLHLDSLCALVEYRWVRQTTNTDVGDANGDNPRYATVFVIQAGYALPCLLVSGAVIEPVARYTNMDYNRAGNECSSMGGSEYAVATSGAPASGNQYDLGVNWYPSAGTYSNKVSLLYTHWLGEASNSDVNGAVAGDDYKAKADIVRVQYQWLF